MAGTSIPVCSQSKWVMRATCALGLLYCAVTLVGKQSFALTAFGDIAQTTLSAFVVLAFALPIRCSQGRVRTFWILMTVGVFCWFVSQSIWAYFEIIQRKEVVDPSFQDIVLFLHLIPMMGALAAVPHSRLKMPPVIPCALAMIAVWWMFLYSYAVLPWQYVVADYVRYGADFNILYTIEDVVFMAVLCVLAVHASGPWRTLYRRLLLGSTGYMFSAWLINSAINEHAYYTGSYYDLPLIFAIVCICWSGASANTPIAVEEVDETSIGDSGAEWLTRLAFLALLSVPVLAFWALRVSRDPEPVRNFRVVVSLVAIVALGALFFIIQRVLSLQLRRKIAEVKQSNEELQRAREALQHQATHDSMTGVMNRGAITDALERELSRAARSQTRVAVLLIDLDHFKEINDRFGHAAGDAAIVGASVRFQECIRSHDYLGRYGGEEFLAVVPETEYPTAIEIAERIRTHFSATPIMWNSNQISLTATIGVALSRPDDTAQTLLRRADVALYTGKNVSRDTVQVADEDIFAA